MTNLPYVHNPVCHPTISTITKSPAVVHDRALISAFEIGVIYTMIAGRLLQATIVIGVWFQSVARRLPLSIRLPYLPA